MNRFLPFFFFLLVADVESQESVDSAASPVKRTRATLEVVSIPAGANVFLDATLVGVTPLIMTDVPYGKHSIRLSLEGHADFVDTVQLRFGNPLRLSPRLARFGALVVRSDPPGIRVFVADTLVGFSPLVLGPATPGRTTVRLVDPVYLPASYITHIPEGDTARVNVQLVHAFSYLTLTTDNPAAVVRIDGKTLGMGNVDLVQVPSGMRSLVVVDTTNGQSVSSILYMKPGGTVKAEVPFKTFQWKPILASVLLPGTGQLMDGSWTSGAAYGAGFLCAAGWTLTRAKIYRTQLDAYETTRRLYSLETDSEKEMILLRHKAQQQLADAKNARSWLLVSVATAAVIYGLNIYNIFAEHAEGPSLIVTLDQGSFSNGATARSGNLTMQYEVRW